MQRCLSLAAVLLLLAGCGGLPANVVVLLPDDDGHTGRVAVRNAAGQVDLDQPLAATSLATGARPRPAFVAKQRDVDASFAAAIAATPHRPVGFILYFRSEAADVAPAWRPTLASAIAAVKAEPNVDVSVVGHTDAAGTDAFNMDLSLRRAEAVRDALVGAGIPAQVIQLAYHGAHDPVAATPPDGHQPLNRRVEVTVR
jgi:outer membrane protein OmpA-like peptidoglycan-associated protein